MFAASKTDGVSGAVNYIEDVFSTYLYDGTNATLSINNGIDLSTYGGLTFFKYRNLVDQWYCFDTARGANKSLASNTTAAQVTRTNYLNSFNTNGFTVGVNLSTSGYNIASWTFREQPKFFDVVTYTGTGSARTIAHNLGSAPACMIIKSTTAATSWAVYHTSLGQGNFLTLDSSNASTASTAIWNNTSPTATVFSVGTSGAVNASGQTFVAYLFAHDAGGFGLTGTDNVISCGSYTGNGLTAGPSINLGYEPQWVMIKRATDDTGDWKIFDTMRGIATGGTVNLLEPNTSDAEEANNDINVAATGFNVVNSNIRINASGSTYIYIAIRRGPMKVPTTGTSVFGMSARAGTGAVATVTGGQTDDAVLVKNRGSAVASLFSSRLTGTGYLVTSTTAAEVAAGTTILQANPWDVMDGVKVGTTSTITNATSNTYINYLFKRAPSFMDVVCYTGTGANLTLSHNLQAAPELIITKKRSAVNEWYVTHSFTASGYKRQYLEQTAAASSHLYSDNFVFTAQSTTTSLFYGSNSNVNQSSQTFVNYLFATLAGVSKVGSYTGNGSSQTINCGFTGGARFVLIKRTDSTGDWYVWDTARGIVAGNDPHLSLNTTAAEVTTDDTIDTDSTGFVVNQVAATNVNVTSATYIFLAIA